jgi:hypothetical protein
MIAVAHVIGHGFQAAVWFIAMLLFIIAAVVAWFAPPARLYWAFIIALGLALAAGLNFLIQIVA